MVIADDEPLARQRIEDLLAKEENVEIAGIATDGDQAVEVIQASRPDVVFLDVQMPGRSGLEVVETIGAEEMPVTIFVTAFDQYALKAFEVAAVDYLVKPFDDERFEQAFRRARRAVESQPPRHEYLERIPVEMRGQLRVVPVSLIDYITASGPYAELHLRFEGGQRTFAIRERMQSLEERLDPALFLRIHRSVIVRLDRVETLLRGSGGDYAVRLKDGTELSVSRARREELEQRLVKT